MKILSGNIARISLSMGIAACAMAGAYAQQPQPQKGGTAIIGSTEPNLLNSVISTDVPNVLVGCIVHEGLVVFNTKGEASPALAESWKVSEDGLTYTMKLRDTKWHDGEPFTSEDVRYTLMEVASKLHPTFSAQVGKNLEAVETPDPHTAVIKLKQPYGPFLLTLSCPLAGGILPSHVFKGTDPLKNKASTEKSIGTGPFKFAEWAYGNHITLVRNDDYWDKGKPYLDTIEMKFIANSAARSLALMSGEIDYLGFNQFPVSDAKIIRANPKYQIQPTGWPPNTLWGFMNLKRKPLDDMRVRDALLVATDRNYVFNTVFNGLGKPATAPWTVQIPWATDPTINFDNNLPFNPEKAAQMLEDAGYKADADGVRLKLNITYDSVSAERNNLALALQSTWKRAGIQLELRQYEAAVLMPRVHKDMDFDIYLGSYSSYWDPAIGISRAFITSTIGRNFGNASGYSNAEVDKLFEKAAGLTTLEDRGAVYRQIQQILAKDMPALPLHENLGIEAATAKLHGLWGWGGDGLWGNAWLEP